MTRAHAAFASAHDLNDAGSVIAGAVVTDAEGAADVAVASLADADEAGGAGSGCAGGTCASGGAVAATERGAPGAQPRTIIAMTCGSVAVANLAAAANMVS